MLLAATMVCALGGCWQQIEYEGSDSAADQSHPPAASADTAAAEGLSPAQRSDALSETALSDAAHRVALAASDDSAGRHVDSPGAPPSAVPETSAADDTPFTLPPDDTELRSDDASTASISSLPQPTVPPTPTESQAAETSATIDELFGPSSTARATAPSPSSAASPTTSETTAPAATDRHVSTSTSPATPQPPSTRRLAWLLGSKWSLAALAADRGAPRSEVDRWFNQSQTLAQALGVVLPALPETDRYAASATDSHAGLDYLFRQGQQVGRELLRKYGVDHAALLEMAVKSNMLLVLYEPGSADAAAVSTAIDKAGRRAELPAELYQPLLGDLADGASPADVSRAVFRLHAAVDGYLATPQP